MLEREEAELRAAPTSLKVGGDVGTSPTMKEKEDEGISPTVKKKEKEKRKN